MFLAASATASKTHALRQKVQAAELNKTLETRTRDCLCVHVRTEQRVGKYGPSDGADAVVGGPLALFLPIAVQEWGCTLQKPDPRSQGQRLVCAVRSAAA